MSKNKSFQITREMIQEMTDPTYFERGEDYQRWGMVENGWITDWGLKAKVKGSSKPYYRVEITISDVMEISGSCSCPIGFGCKHCVAVCLQYLHDPGFFNEKKPSKMLTKSDKYELEPEIIDTTNLSKTNVVTIQEFAASLTVDALRSKFVEIWDRFAPDSSKNAIDPDYPFKFWTGKIVEISEININERHKKVEETSTRWFTPLQLFSFLGETTYYDSLLSDWTSSYIELANYIKEEFQEIGIDNEDIDFDPEYYFIDDLENYDDHFDYDNDNDPSELADEYFSQFNEIFTEMEAFYEILLSSKKSELAQAMLEKGLKWFIDLKIPDEYKYELEELIKIQKRIDELLKNMELFSLEGKERLNFLVKMHLKFKTKETREKLMRELKSLISDSDNRKKKENISEIHAESRALTQKTWEKLRKNYESKMTADDLLFLAELNKNLLHEAARTQFLVKDTLLKLNTSVNNSYELINAIWEWFQMQPPDCMDWLYSVILKESLSDQNRGFLLSHVFERFLKYYLPKGDINRIIELCNQFIKFCSDSFRFTHYVMLNNYSKQDSNFSEEFILYLKNELLPNLIKKKQFNVANQIFLAEADFSSSIELINSHFDPYSAWDLIQKLLSKIKNKDFQFQSVGISLDNLPKLFNTLNRYIRESITSKSKHRPDKRIAQSVQLFQHLYKYFNLESEGIKWFTKFCANYRRYRNLRAELKSIGIVMI